MDETTHFLELSALLTGLYDQLLNDPEDRKLNIVGSSVFTTSATANTTLTIAALTLRAAAAIHR